MKREAFRTFDRTEEFIEDHFPIAIRESLEMNCKVSQDGFRPAFLRNIQILKSRYNLEFFIEKISVNPPYDLYWKVLNVGAEAERRNQVRGQIFKDKGHRIQKEQSSFKGEHLVEAYVVKNNRVFARDTISVNIDDF